MSVGGSLGKSYVEIDLDFEPYNRSSKRLVQEAASASTNIEENFRRLGIKSSDEFDLMRQRAEKSFDMIANSAKASASDILRAEQAKSEQLQRINEQQFGRQIGLIDSLKAHWLEIAAVMGTVYAAMQFAQRVEGWLNEVDAISRHANAMGLSTKAFQEYQYIAVRADISQENFNSAMDSFVKKLGELQYGTGELHSKLKLMDEGFLRNLKSANTTEQALDLYLQKLDQTTNAQERVALSAAAFGRGGGVAMVGMIRDGYAEMERMREAASSLGVVLSDELIEKAEYATEQLKIMYMVIKAQLLTVLSELAPKIGSTAEYIASLMKHFDELKTIAGAFIAFGLGAVFVNIGASAVTAAGGVTSLAAAMAALKATTIGGWLAAAGAAIGGIGVAGGAAGLAAYGAKKASDQYIESMKPYKIENLGYESGMQSSIISGLPSIELPPGWKISEHLKSQIKDQLPKLTNEQVDAMEKVNDIIDKFTLSDRERKLKNLNKEFNEHREIIKDMPDLMKAYEKAYENTIAELKDKETKPINDIIDELTFSDRELAIKKVNDKFVEFRKTLGDTKEVAKAYALSMQAIEEKFDALNVSKINESTKLTSALLDNWYGIDANIKNIGYENIMDTVVKIQDLNREYLQQHKLVYEIGKGLEWQYQFITNLHPSASDSPLNPDYLAKSAITLDDINQKIKQLSDPFHFGLDNLNIQREQYKRLMIDQNTIDQWYFAEKKNLMEQNLNNSKLIIKDINELIGFASISISEGMVDSFTDAFREILAEGKVDFEKLGQSIRNVFTDVISDIAKQKFIQPAIGGLFGGGVAGYSALMANMTGGPYNGVYPSNFVGPLPQDATQAMSSGSMMMGGLGAGSMAYGMTGMAGAGIGAGLGFMLGGPMGALAGGAGGMLLEGIFGGENKPKLDELIRENLYDSVSDTLSDAVIQGFKQGLSSSDLEASIKDTINNIIMDTFITTMVTGSIMPIVQKHMQPYLDMIATKQWQTESAGNSIYEVGKGLFGPGGMAASISNIFGLQYTPSLKWQDITPEMEASAAKGINIPGMTEEMMAEIQPILDVGNMLREALGMNTDATQQNTDAILGPIEALLRDLQVGGLAPAQSIEGYQAEYNKLFEGVKAGTVDTSTFAGFAREYLEFGKAYGGYGGTTGKMTEDLQSLMNLYHVPATAQTTTNPYSNPAIASVDPRYNDPNFRAAQESRSKMAIEGTLKFDRNGTAQLVGYVIRTDPEVQSEIRRLK